MSEAQSRRNIAESELRAVRLQARERVRSTFLQIQASEAQTEAALTLAESTALAAGGNAAGV